MRNLFSTLVLLVFLTCGSTFGQIVESDSLFQIRYPFHYVYTKNSYLIVYDDSLFNHLQSDSSWIPLNTLFISGVGEKYVETLDKSKLDTLGFFYPGTEQVYYRLNIKSTIATLTFFDLSGNLMNEFKYDKRVTEFRITYNETWTSPPYPAYNYLKILKPKR